MFIISTTTQLKRSLLEHATRNGRSLRGEVLDRLVRGYQPPGWKELLKTLKDRESPRSSVRAGVIDDGGREVIGLPMPPELREFLELVAAENGRSLTGEIVHFLKGDVK